MPDLTVILTSYRRPELLPSQVDAIRSQSRTPKEIWLWANEPSHANTESFNRLGLDRIVSSNTNAHVHARFALALTARTEFVAIFDDDTLPGSLWFENCEATFARQPGILGSAGVRLRDAGYRSRTIHGWHDPTEDITQVDL